MLHRPADSRLLANLLSHEKEHAKALAAQIDSAQASLSSFSAYASASPPPASHAIVAVAGTLVGANDALRTYLFAVEEWCEQLRELKELEDEVGNVVRDREILVDRLIKASKTTQKRRSVISNSGSPTSSMFASSSAVGLEQLAFSNSKLNLAQNELQACEAHLADREKALAQMRENVVIKGLKGRCKAMVECGWKWGEMGKEGTRALEGLNMNGYPYHSDNPFLKPLPDPHATHSRPSSDMSSIAPSQSASQNAALTDGGASPFSSPPSSQAHGSGMASTSSRPVSDAGVHEYVLQIPPAHSISDQLLPPSRVIQEEEEEGGGSSDGESEENEGALEVHENKPFAFVNNNRHSTPPPPKSKPLEQESPRRNSTLPSSVSAPMPITNLDIYGNSRDSPPRERKNSKFLGSFMGLFHKRGRTASLSSLPSVNASPPKQRKGSPWITRTDKNLKKTKDDSSDDEGDRRPAATTSINYEALRQKSMVEAKALPAPSSQQSSPEKRSKGTKKLRKPSEAQRRNTPDFNASKVSLSPERPPIPKSASKKSLVEDSVTSTSTNETIQPVSAPISRSSTVKSVSSNGSGRRSASLDGGPSRTPSRRSGTRSDIGHSSPARSTASPSPSSRSNHTRNFSTPMSNGMSLMSIIEDVTAANRRGWNQANPSNMLFQVKAPPTSVLVDDLRRDDGPPETPSPTSRTQPVRQGSNASSVQARRLGSMGASSSEPHLPLNRGSRSTRQPDQDRPPVPLRSALRNRSPSPVKPVAPLIAPRSSSPAKMMEHEMRPRANSPSVPIPRVKELTIPSNSRRDSFASDTSISSYATGREEFEEEEEQLMIDPTPHASESETTPQQVIVELPPLPNGFTNGYNNNNPHRHDAEGKQASESASSDSTASGPSRRKSVRMAPLPTFSPTPPAIYDDEVDHAPWAGGGGGGEKPATATSIAGWQTRISNAAAADVWEDSDGSDEEYSRAKQLLLRASQKAEKKKQPSY